jgi:predicted RNA-binding protein with PIN domain
VSLAAGRDALVSRFQQKYRHTPHRVIIVFDGNDTARHTHPIRGLFQGQVIYSAQSETADAVIAEIADQEAEAGADLTVISDDLEVRLNATNTGSHSASVTELAQHLNQPDKYRVRRYRHQQYMRSQWEHEGEDNDRSGNPRRPPRQRRRPDRRPF